MTIYLNSESITVDDGISLMDLMESKEFINTKGIAVAVNNCVINRAAWTKKLLQENDKVLVISATKGG